MQLEPQPPPTGEQTPDQGEPQNVQDLRRFGLGHHVGELIPGADGKMIPFEDVTADNCGPAHLFLSGLAGIYEDIAASTDPEEKAALLKEAKESVEAFEAGYRNKHGKPRAEA